MVDSQARRSVHDRRTLSKFIGKKKPDDARNTFPTNGRRKQFPGRARFGAPRNQVKWVTAELVHACSLLSIPHLSTTNVDFRLRRLGIFSDFAIAAE